MELDATEVRRLADELAIRALVARYADSVTSRDGDAWVETWAEDGSWTIGGNTSTGHAALRATWNTLMALFERVIQLPQHARLDLAGDRGTGHWGVLEIGRTTDGAASFTLGSYSDVYRRTKQGWRFSERRFHFHYTGPPDLSGHWTQ